MNQVLEFFSKIFESRDWLARWNCGNWGAVHGWLYIVSDLLIGLVYFVIPLIIFNYVKKKREDVPFSGIYLLFASFLLLCGITHLLDVVMFWVPAYRLNTLIRLTTAAAGLTSVYFLFKLLPSFFRQQTYNSLVIETERRKEAERKLAIANADLEKFAYVASHDLQEPLRKIILFSEMLEQRNITHFDDRSSELIQKTIRSSYRMQRLITDVLSLSKLTDDVPFNRVNLGTVIDRALEDLEMKISDRNAVITRGELPDVKGNEGYLQQLFYNLVGNAIKFSTDQPEISISGTESDDKVLILVSDKGIGIDEEYFEKIFLPFQRLNGSAQFEGSGIGLSLCKKIVSIHGGNLSVKSEPGKGSTFVVELPKP